ncbi:phage tail protein [Duganella sp. FT27W]|uniref:phage tail protein n=1 Tax=Duganella sp. FT27W TaxID=2654636 RepID=UPI00128E4715|nr:tail fiber protein [Duganella sp. FT27W]MPQ56785.1 phage tail protein [Duganella sp. FT27W]
MDPFLAEIRLFAFGITPKGWMPCEGQLLQISTNVALFSLLSNQYGGDGKVTFALPDLRGRVPLGYTSVYPQGTAGGEAQHSLTIAEMPTHNHLVNASSNAVSTATPIGSTWASFDNGYSATQNASLSPLAIAVTGGSLPHQNMQPSMALNFCIAVSGLYPPRP